MNADSGVDLTALKVDGGMVVNETLMQFQADILGVPVIRPVVAETTALGAAYAAGLAVGFWETEDDIRTNWAEDKRWEPQMDDATRAEAATQVEEGRHQDLRLGRRRRLKHRIRLGSIVESSRVGRRGVWGVGQDPWIVVDELTIQEAAGPIPHLAALLVVVVLAGVIVLPALAYLFGLTQTETWTSV